MVDYHYLLVLFCFVNETIAKECDKNVLDGMCVLGVIQLNLVFIINYSVFMSQVQGFG